jgi:hypothetical protein
MLAVWWMQDKEGETTYILNGALCSNLLTGPNFLGTCQ